MSRNNGIVLNGVLRNKLLNIPLLSCFLINLEFLLPHIVHFNNSIVLSFRVFETLEVMFSVFSYTLNNIIGYVYT